MQNCDISFTGKDDLNGHINAVHDEKKPFKCEFCDYSYDQIDILQQHVASVHEGKKPFIFEYCDYCSYQKEDVQQHVASVHEGKKPFKCEYCDYCSNQKGDMQQHVASVHGKESCSSKVNSIKNMLKVLAVNVRGIECFGRLDQVKILLDKYSVSVALLTVTETTHSMAQTTDIEGFKAFFSILSYIVQHL